MAKDKGNSVFRAVMKGVNSTTGDSSKARAEQGKRTVEGRDKAAQDRARRNTQTAATNRRREQELKREREERWSKRPQG